MMGRHIRDRRQRLGLKQHELGLLAGWTTSGQSNVSAVETNHASHDAEAKVIAALDAAEAERGLPPLRPPRDHRLAARRQKLKLTHGELGELAGFPVGAQGAYQVSQAERGRGPDADAMAIRRALVWEESKARRAREDLRRESRRIAFQRSLWAALPDHPAVRALKAAMLDRCQDLMHAGNGRECDALAEFLPDGDVEAMFERWWAESFPDEATQETGLPADEEATIDPARAAAIFSGNRG